MISLCVPGAILTLAAPLSPKLDDGISHSFRDVRYAAAWKGDKEAGHARGRWRAQPISARIGLRSQAPPQATSFLKPIMPSRTDRANQSVPGILTSRHVKNCVACDGRGLEGRTFPSVADVTAGTRIEVLLFLPMLLPSDDVFDSMHCARRCLIGNAQPFEMQDAGFRSASGQRAPDHRARQERRSTGYERSVTSDGRPKNQTVSSTQSLLLTLAA